MGKSVKATGGNPKPVYRVPTSIMTIKRATAEWSGDLVGGHGTLELASHAYKGDYSFHSRMEGAEGTSPEELLGAAHAGCFSMALSGMLAAAGYPPTRVRTVASVSFGKDGPTGWAIKSIELDTEVEAPGLSLPEFHRYAEAARIDCPISKALACTEVRLNARLM